MIVICVILADPADPAPESARALAHARAAAGRFPGRVEVEVVPLEDPRAQALGIGVEPTVLVGKLAVAVGLAPPAGHLVRALQAALDKETSP